MSDDRRRILDILAEGKISVDEAERLLSVIEPPAGGGAGASGTAHTGKAGRKYLVVRVEPGTEGGPGASTERVNIRRVQLEPGTGGGPGASTERVNIRVPLSIIRAGIKLGSLMPSNAATKLNEALKSKGIDLDIRHVKEEDVEQLIDALSDLEVDVQGGHEKVRVYVE